MGNIIANLLEGLRDPVNLVKRFGYAFKPAGLITNTPVSRVGSNSMDGLSVGRGAYNRMASVMAGSNTWKKT
jgi:hypothetical protein